MEDIKIVLLKSRQHVITKLSELRTEEDEPLCFLFEVPFVITYQMDYSEENKNDVKISFSQMMPFSNTLEFRIPFEYVITIGSPKPDIVEKYIEVLKPYYPIINDAEPNKLTEEEE
jgi:hypothetical protein